MKTDYKFIHFQEQLNPGMRTRRFQCLTGHNAPLGEVKWYGPWRQYCFFPRPDTVFSKGCLDDINDFILQLTEERRRKGSA